MSEINYYQICIQCDFEYNKINDYCLKNNLNLKDLKKKVILYLKNNLNKTILDLNDKEIIFLLGKKELQIISKFKKLITEIINTTNQEYLWFDTIGCICLYLLDYFKKCNFNKDKIYKMLELYELNTEKTCELVARYALNMARIKEDLVKEYFSCLVNKNLDSTHTLLKKILNCNNQDVINNLLDNSIQNYNYVKSQIHDFLIQNYKNDYIACKNNLENKFNNYHQYKIKKKKLEQELKNIEKNTIERKNNLDISCNIIRSFIGSHFKTKDDFCNFNNISLKKFDYYVSIVKEFNQELYNLYFEKIEKIRKQNYAILMSLIENIIYLLKNGITINGNTRPFDLLDYYKITNLDRNKVLKLIKSNEHYDEEEYRLFLNFTRKYANSCLLKERDIKRLLTEKHEIVIPNSNLKKEITTEEKIFILNYLNFYKIPLYDTIYYIAIKRYITSELNLDDLDKKHLTITI